MLDILPDLFDIYPTELTLIPIPFQSFGGHTLFYGELITVRCFEDNSRVKELLNQAGEGKVLLVDGGGSVNRALLGDLIAESAVANGWSGVVIHGGVRDVGTIATLPLGVKALAPVPIKTDRKGLGDVNVQLELAGVNIESGMWLYADENGVAVAHSELKIPRDNG